MSLATYTFSSLVHRGFTADATAAATVTVTVAGQVPIVQPVALMTPADVTGIPPRQVIRTWPLDGVRNAEPNYLALVEFDAPDLPWLVSRPDGDGRTPPWVALVVVDETELDEDPLTHSANGAILSVDGDQLPDPRESWLWAHSQLLGTDAVPGDPARSLSRLVCPRRLDPNRSYLACVVPVYEVGAMAGRGEPADAVEAARTSTTLAWDPAGGPVQLPVYAFFRFATGASGDFESLVRRLHGVPLPPGMGRRRLRLDHPGSGMPASLVGDLALDVALRRPDATTTPVRDLVQPENALGTWLDALLGRLADAGYDLSLAAAGTPPRVGPPVYGQLPVGATARAAVVDTPSVPPWLREVNVDPRLRVAAGLGAEVVRRHQEHYVEQAWRQVGEVLAANRLRRRAEYSLATSQRLYSRWIEQLDTGDLLSATSPVHARIAVAPGETVVGRLRNSPVPPAAVSVELRRFSRRRGALPHASSWQVGLDATAVARRSAEAEPFVSRVPLDSVERLRAPSVVWGVERASSILTSLVSGGGIEGMPAAEAAERLDAVSRLGAFDLPSPDLVASRLAAAPVEVDRALAAVGLLPTRMLLDAVTPGPDEPGGEVDESGGARGPGRRPPRGRARGTGLGSGLGSGLRSGLGSGRSAALRRGAGTRGLEDLLLVRPGGTPLELAAVIRPTTVVATVRVNPSLLTRVGDTVVVDTVALELASRTGKDATTVTRQLLDDATAGTLEASAVADLAFEVPVERLGAVRDEIGEAVQRLAELVISPGDAAPRPGRRLEGGLDALRAPVLAALDPRVTLTRAVNSRISDLLEEEAEVFDDIMAAPDLSEPTYSRLAEISHDWLLPGIDSLPADSTTLVAANLAFIEAFLVGMNHELARELLWREYPTDQRGTYARQFWTHVASPRRSDQFDLKRDLHRSPAQRLVELSRPEDGPAPGTPVEDPLVLVVKGELVQRYPGVLVCAARTAAVDGMRVPRADTMLMPDFVGRLEPDVLLVGFTGLTARMVREAADEPDQAWWFFFAEHFSEPRFGLDELEGDTAPGSPATWNDAAWEHADLGDRPFLTAASFAADLPKRPGTAPSFRWGRNAADQAWITLQFPFRRGMPALDLLPPTEGADPP